MEWEFILAVLNVFGFSTHFQHWLLAIFKSARLSIIFNGGTFGYFPCSRGVRQGDPLSPLLFCPAEDFLSRQISKATETGALQPLRLGQLVFPSHLFYADGFLIFGKASLHDIGILNSIFLEYEKLSGQVVSWGKSFLFTSSNVTR